MLATFCSSLLSVYRCSVAHGVVGRPLCALAAESASGGIPPVFEQVGISEVGFKDLVRQAKKLKGKDTNDFLNPEKNEKIQDNFDALGQAGLDTRDKRNIAMIYPKLFDLDTKELVDHLRYLLGQYSMTIVDLRRVLTASPRVLDVPVKQGYVKMTNFLAQYGVTSGDMRLMLRRMPKLLGHSVENELKPAVEGLLELGVSRVELHEILVGSPQLLTREFHTSVLPKLVWFKAELGFEERWLWFLRKRGRLIASRSLEQMQMTYAKLLDFGLTKEQRLRVVNKNPEVLGEKLGSVYEKMYFLHHFLLMEPEMVAQYPQYLLRAHEGRLLTRIGFLELHKQDYRDKTLKVLLETQNEAFPDLFEEVTNSEFVTFKHWFDKLTRREKIDKITEWSYEPSNDVQESELLSREMELIKENWEFERLKKSEDKRAMLAQVELKHFKRRSKH